MKARGIHHTNVTVDDLDAAMHFYVDVLGMTERDDRPDFGIAGAWLAVGDQQVHLVVGTPNPDGHHFALLIDDLDSAMADVSSHGVAVKGPFDGPTARQAFVLDPSGNAIELQQPRY